MRLSQLGENAFLRELRTRFPPHPDVPIGIGDDAALLRMPPDERVLVTVDSLVEGTHFESASTPPRFVGRKSVGASASDVAAMGGRPTAAVLSLLTPAAVELDTLWEVIDGAAERCQELDMSLVGGNLARSPAGLILDVTVLGHTLGGRCLTRSGARPGDGIFLSGTVGASAGGLKLLQAGVVLSSSGGVVVPSGLGSGPMDAAADCIRAHLDPEPRVSLGQALNAAAAASACIDVSDGLAMDLHRLCDSSEVAARIDAADLPVSRGLTGWEHEWGPDGLALALSGGEDYELLFTSSDERASETFSTDGVPVTRVGEVVAREVGAPVVTLRRTDGSMTALDADGWDHFQRV